MKRALIGLLKGMKFAVKGLAGTIAFTVVTSFITNLANSVLELNECHKKLIAQVISAMDGISLMYDTLSFLPLSGIGKLLLYASMPVAIYPIIASATLGIQQCSVNTSARMANYAVRSLNIVTMSAGGGKSCPFPQYRKNGHMINSSTLDDGFKHINDVTLNGAGKAKFNESHKLVGCHNEVNFNKQVYKKDFNEDGRIEIIRPISSSVTGIKKVEYKVFKLDKYGKIVPGKYIGGDIPKTHIKTLYDPKVYSESSMKELGYKAYKDAMDNNSFTERDKSFKGYADGMPISGHYIYKDGEKVINSWWIDQ